MSRRGFVAGLAAAVSASCSHLPERDVISIGRDSFGEGLDPYRAPVPGTDRFSWLYGDALASGSSWRGLTAGPPSVSADGYGVEYELMPSLRWHDGREVTARDVADAFDRVAGGPWGRGQPYRNVRSLTVRGARHVSVRLYQRDPWFPTTFFGPHGTPALPVLRSGPQPIGTGPFTIAGNEFGTEVVGLRAFTGSPRGRPRIARVRLSNYPDADTRTTALLTGEADIAWGILPERLAGSRIRWRRRHDVTVIALANTHGQLRTPLLRSAFFACLDTPRIARDVYGAPAEGPAPSAAGAALLTRERIANLRLPCVPGPMLRCATMIQDQLRHAGITVQIALCTQEELFAENGPLRSGRYDVAISALPRSVYPELLENWGCAAVPPEGENFSRYCDPEFDRLVKSQRASAALLRLHAAHVFAPIAPYGETLAVRPEIAGVPLDAELPPALACQSWRLA